MKLQLISKKKLIENITSFNFKINKSFTWNAGQYLIYNLDYKNSDLRGKQRFFTISSSPFEKHVTITTRIFSKNPSSFKNALNNLKIGQTINAKGPDGDFVIENYNKKYIFIAGGIGITPFISIIRQLNFENKKINITLLYSNKNKKIAFKNDLDKIKKTHSEFKIKYVLNPTRIDEKLLKPYIKKNLIYYISGPDPLVDSITEVLNNLGVRNDNIKQDYFSGYKN